MIGFIEVTVKYRLFADIRDLEFKCIYKSGKYYKSSRSLYPALPITCKQIALPNITFHKQRTACLCLRIYKNRQYYFIVLRY